MCNLVGDEPLFRILFVWLVVFAVLLGADLAVVCFAALRFHQVHWSETLNIVLIGLLR